MDNYLNYLYKITLFPFLLSQQALSTPYTLTNRIIEASDSLLERGDISYAWGGAKIKGSRECELCQSCLRESSPKPKKQLLACPSCQDCSLDCSHFIQQVFGLAGIDIPYLTTNAMLNTPHSVLKQRYGFLRLSGKANLQPSDLIVYEGHVVLLEKLHKGGRGDIIHATSGRELRGPGQGIQRARFVPLENFKGPILAVLRHIDLLPAGMGKVIPRRIKP